ncbi:MAG: adenylate/guanylate cyclase domain-containing protein [Rhodospirillaceae bacterium]|jgi:adenylate cyclase|nr:adenylate/guanylate cyclase domain-containing protein [Rhodospirillaceae bacterium]MBT5195159.1 adenylate/guanylate cyclase domain-containing protein [Rhodospirillaceae bacterium]MBT5894717.1 adenylate/guanylate cyclase domain-containing protein [Rhodospirillaceae bacterium]MBT6429112.1 adenylate/guanylate cyclase domain-containing protein [Rhodospirillaceae bacterium]MBT7760743.1 adenylate/guanylate cyclase domain-containing protein [Rhodospirillaceae bacterium]
MNIKSNDIISDQTPGEWLIKRGLAGDSVDQLAMGLCQRLTNQGLPLLRAFIGLQTLHPLYGGYAYIWRRGVAGLETEYYLRQQGHNPDFLTSPLHHMRQLGQFRYRQRLEGPADPEFSIYEMFRGEGGTDYFVRLFPFGQASGSEREDGIMISMVFDKPGGMSDEELHELEGILEVFALSARSAATYATALNVASTYLGRDAGQRVMDGDIDRGTAASMRAVIYYADLRGFTPLAESLPGADLLAMLDDYLDAIARPVLEQGGEVLKFLGDGVLAVFEITGDDAECQVACQQGMTAGRAAFAAVGTLNRDRGAADRPIMEMDLALHIGNVLYGNVGAEGRLDFTVIGPAVNEASRIEAMCGELDRNWLVSEAFFEQARHCSNDLQFMGQHQLRGLRGTRALYSLPLDKIRQAAP